MKLKAITFRPHADVEVTREEVLVLAECSAAHYDGLCKQSVERGVVRGLINRLTLGNDTLDRTVAPLSRDDLDLLSKIAEVAQYLKNGELFKIGVDIQWSIKRIFTAMRDATPERIVYGETGETDEKLFCARCGSDRVSANLHDWESRSNEDHSNRAMLAEHQCDTCGASFWT